MTAINNRHYAATGNVWQSELARQQHVVGGNCHIALNLEANFSQSTDLSARFAIGRLRLESQPGLTRTKVNSAFHPSRVGK